MTAPEPHTAPRTPPALAVALGALGLGAVAVVWTLARFWGANAGYADRFLILLGAGWAAWQARPDLLALPRRPSIAGWVLLIPGAVLFAFGWFLQAQVAPKPVLLWWLTAAWAAAAGGYVLRSFGPAHLRRLAFPLAFLFFALPIPNRVLLPLQAVLQSATTSAAAAVLPAVGVPVERSGCVLALPNGDLGVAEACSGVRSVTALTAIAAYVAYLNGFGPPRGLLLVALSVPVIAAVNAFRVVASGLIQEHAGARYIQGDWHEGFGILMVFVGLGLILGLARLLGGRQPAAPPTTADHAHHSSLITLHSLPTAPAAALALAAALAVAAHLLGRGTEEELAAVAPLADVPTELGPWKGRDLEVPEYVRELLVPDAVVHRAYTRDLGFEVGVWAIFWTNQNMTKGYHHPDVCWPNRGWTTTAKEVAPVTLAGGGELPVTLREFASGRDKRLVLYWTQEGRKVWTQADEDAARLTGDSHNWLGDRLFRADRGAAEASGRLVVLVGTPTWGDGTEIRRQTLDFTRAFADELYRLCPWAEVRPPAPPAP